MATTASGAAPISPPTPNPEYKYEIALFGIRSLTNLHVGSGSENYGIIDNLIQRDQATNFPCIYSSSIKGALREYCRNYLNGGNLNDMLTHIFGKDKKDTNDTAEDTPAPDGNFIAGKYRFMQADLLSIPIRAMEKPYFNATCPWLLKNITHITGLYHKQLEGTIQALQNELAANDAVHFGTGSANVDIDGVNTVATATTYTNSPDAMLGSDMMVLKDEHFVELVSDFKLPVIARNNLNDGRSANLWYEQVLPSDTRLAFLVLYPKGDNHFPAFKKAILANPVQIGANASIGYGFCSLYEIPLTPKTPQ